MPLQLYKIASTEVGSGGAANITFSSIPQGYTDLKLVITVRSARTGSSADSILFYINSSNSGSDKILYANGSTAGSAVDSSQMYCGTSPASTAITGAFSNVEVYIPNYSGTATKSYSVDSVDENNTTFAQLQMLSGLWSSSSAINALRIEPGSATTFTQYSSATLYGIL
jgi:hypothetical protein